MYRQYFLSTVHSFHCQIRCCFVKRVFWEHEFKYHWPVSTEDGSLLCIDCCKPPLKFNVYINTAAIWLTNISTRRLDFVGLLDLYEPAGQRSVRYSDGRRIQRFQTSKQLSCSKVLAAATSPESCVHLWLVILCSAAAVCTWALKQLGVAVGFWLESSMFSSVKVNICGLRGSWRCRSSRRAVHRSSGSTNWWDNASALVGYRGAIHT